MKLDLRDIIEVPGGAVAFETELDVSRLMFPAVSRYVEPPYAEGEVRNEAGVLHLRASIEAELICVCDRCGREFLSFKETDVDALVTESGEGADEAEAFELEGDRLDVSEALETAFILDMESKFLCKEDCRGVCEKCGRDLNEGPCDCRKEIDPRLAVLEQLLDK